MTTTLRIQGMTCNHCVGTVTKALRGVPGVTAVEVTLPDRATITHGDQTDQATLTAAVDEAGYTAIYQPT